MEAREVDSHIGVSSVTQSSNVCGFSPVSSSTLVQFLKPGRNSAKIKASVVGLAHPFENTSAIGRLDKLG
jgi:hypothetical protein